MSSRMSSRAKRVASILPVILLCLAANCLANIAQGDGPATIRPQGEVATCGRDGLVKLWSAEGTETKKFSAADDTPADAKPPAGVRLMPTRVAVSGDGSFVLAGDTAGRLHGWAAK